MAAVSSIFRDKRYSMRLMKVMLVGPEIPDQLLQVVLDTGARVTTLPNGKTAVSHAHHETFDVAIIVSTGEEMDLAETVFNLRDVNRSMQVIIVSERSDVNEGAIPKKALVRLVPNTKVMTAQELKRHLELS